MTKFVFILYFAFYGCNSNLNSSQENLKKLEEFAINFEATKKEDSVIPQMDLGEKNWEIIISQSIKTDSTKTNLYLSLVLLKLYESHLKCCRQSYTLHLKNPFVDNFLQLNDFYESSMIKNLPEELVGDVVWSSLIYDWLSGKVEFLNDNYLNIRSNELIKTEIKNIKYLIEN